MYISITVIHQVLLRLSIARYIERKIIAEKY